MSTLTEKDCTKCGKTKPVGSFRLIGPDRRHPWCRKCEANRAGTRATGSTLHIGDELANALREKATALGVSPSWLARRLITEGLAEMGDAPIRFTRERTA